MNIINKISIALRFILKRKGFTAINVLGLAIGIAACLFITQYVKFHQSFDRQTPHFDRTYRVTYQRWNENGDRVEFASASPTIGTTMGSLFPEVELFARANKTGGVFAYNDQVYEEEQAFFGETNIFEILGFNILMGDADSCLSLPNQAVLSEAAAKRYFGTSNPIGKTLKHNGNENFVVTAVYENCPANLHFKPELFISLATYIKRDPQLFESGWFYSGFYTYVRLAEGSDYKLVDKKIEEFIEREYGEFLAEYKTGLSFKLQPLRDIHLNSHYMHELELNADSNSIALLEIIAGFILIIAWVNFFNLSTISSLKRVKEIGIRKVNGASRTNLIFQLLLESALINFFAILLAVVMFELGYNSFANLAGLPVHTIYYNQGWFFQIMGLAMLVGTISAGIYSVTGIRGNNLSETLRGMIIGLKGNALVKKGLVTFQFAIAIALIAGTVGVFKQFILMQNTNLGFRLENMLVVKVPRVGDNTLRTKFLLFTEKVNEIPSVNGATYSSVVPGKPNMFNRGGIHKHGDDPNNGKNMRLTEIFSNYPEIYDINIIAGKLFTGNPAEDIHNVMLNQRGAQWLGFENMEAAIGSQIILEGQAKTLVGILYDFKQLSPKEEIEPQIFRFPERFQGYFTLQISNKTADKTVREVERVYSSIFPGNPFDYFYLDEFYNAQYQHDRRFGLVFVLFTILSIIITILGLLALSAYSAEQRRREIGIRRVLGATPKNLIVLLSRSYLGLLIIASGIALPTVWYFLRKWLNNYATRVEVDWVVFVVPILVVFIVAFATVFTQSLKAATANPVDSIKQE